MTRFNARTLHAIADDLGCAPELVAAVATETKVRSKVDLRHAVTERLSSTPATPSVDEPVAVDQDAPADDAPAPKKAKKASLTLSQRRALLRLQDGPVVPASPFRALPFGHLIEVGLAVATPDGIALTDAGAERAATINPGYAVWSAGETVAADPTRPVAGTHRWTKGAEGRETVAELTA